MLYEVLHFILYRAKIRMWYGVWAIFQLLYIPLVHTCITLLHCPALPNANGYNHINVC